MKRKNIFLSLFMTLPLLASYLHSSYLFIDTESNSKERYPILNDSEQKEWIPFDYYSLASLLDEDLILADYQGVFFIISNQFLQGIKNQSPLSKKVLNFLKITCKKPNVLVALFLPPSIINPSSKKVAHPLFTPLLQPLLKALDCGNPTLAKSKKSLSSQKKSTRRLWKELNNFLTTPIEKRRTYATTLFPTSKARTTPPSAKLILETSSSRLPSTNTDHLPLPIKQLFPLGIYLNRSNQAKLFFSSTTLLTSTGPEENFRSMPLDEELQNGYRQAINQTFEKLGTRHRPTHALRSIDQKQSNSKQTQTHSRNQIKIKKTAWMEITLFEKKDDKERQKELIKYIYKAGLDSLWISITPNIFYSTIARHKKKEQDCLNAISLFTQLLKDGSEKYAQPIPHILLGFEIANNLYEPNLPKPCATDLYGNEDKDLPAPLNQTFWEQEIIIPLTKFTKKWQELSHGIPLDGIVLDLEMYGRKNYGLFQESMGFDDKTFQAFVGKQAPKALTEKITFLMDEKRGKEYFAFLEENATGIGNTLVTSIRKKIPDCLIACYLPNLQTNWFYQGFLRGLSSKQHPLHLFTFNTNFYTHQNWLNQQEIYASHSSVLLLSKIQGVNNFSLIENILNAHDGIWFNRFSRLAEPYQRKKWFHVEQTPLAYRKKMLFLKYINQA